MYKNVLFFMGTRGFFLNFGERRTYASKFPPRASITAPRVTEERRSRCISSVATSRTEDEATGVIVVLAGLSSARAE